MKKSILTLLILCSSLSVNAYSDSSRTQITSFSAAIKGLRYTVTHNIDDEIMVTIDSCYRGQKLNKKAFKPATFTIQEAELYVKAIAVLNQTALIVTEVNDYRSTNSRSMKFNLDINFTRDGVEIETVSVHAPIIIVSYKISGVLHLIEDEVKSYNNLNNICI